VVTNTTAAATTLRRAAGRAITSPVSSFSRMFPGAAED
jgi:hypothetical protein